MNPNQKDKKIILSSSLQAYFFEGLTELNQKSLCPVPGPVIYYSSEVLDKFSLSQHYFEISEGKVREKILGMKLLEATQLNREDQKKIYKEVADMSLLVCGYFAESVSQKKLLDTQYYAQLGKMAYGHLDTVAPAFLDIPRFYEMVAACFESLTLLMSMLAHKSRSNTQGHLLFDQLSLNTSPSDKELLVSGLLPLATKKIS
jgi:hypothetical protein